ncbi:hypothetical protein Goarm_018763 [Gossypium armourianum]|uniref:Uncharacterized protein n=1 Tax=Gossypium armourianum TaxID=34283 RepID=A0A7J9III3_9ROSI|nr:hypothetical protein [Gossypium armourianum]
MLVWKYEGSGDYTVKRGMCGLRCKFKLLILKIRWITRFALLEHFLKQMADKNDSLLSLYGKLATTAVLARYYKGDVVGAETYLFEDVIDAFVAEARACERDMMLLTISCPVRLMMRLMFWHWKVGEEGYVGAGLMAYLIRCGLW